MWDIGINSSTNWNIVENPETHADIYEDLISVTCHNRWRKNGLCNKGLYSWLPWKGKIKSVPYIILKNKF